MAESLASLNKRFLDLAVEYEREKAEHHLTQEELKRLLQHQHRFTVAVEWLRWDRVKAGDEGVQRHVVVRLRCETCPEEITRG